MKKICLLLIVMACHQCFAKPAEVLDSIVAVVNDDVVTQSEFKRSLTIAKAQISQGGMTMPSQSVFQKEVLDQLINKKLQLQIAKQAGIQISSADIDKIVQDIADKNNISVTALYQRIGQGGMSPSEYRDELRDQIAVQKLQQQEVAKRITVAPGEINTYLQSKLRQTNGGAKEYKIEDILVPLSDAPSAQEMASAKTRAQHAADKLSQGKPYTALAKEEPGLESNDLGWRKLSEIPSVFVKQVTSLQPNEIAGPIQAGNGFHIIRLIAWRSAGGEPAAPDRDQAHQILMQQKFQQNVQTWLSKIRGQAFISMK